jgi:hypothetical protein
MGSEFHLDLLGRLRNFKLPAYRALVPVFEALVNSLHAIEEAGRDDGRVSIEVVRLSSSAPGAQHSLLPDQSNRQPIVGFRVIDNGAGFTAGNYDSFCTSDSRRKLAIGGRGVGRFTWLKAFRRVSIDSVYRQGESCRRRTFTFSPEAGVADDNDGPCENPVPNRTTVTLDGVHDIYAATIPKKTATLGQHIVDHCFGAIRATKRSVQVELVDGEEAIDISAEVAQMFASALVDKLTIEGNEFTVTHIRVSSPEASAHKLIFMADRREVRSEGLSNSIPQLRVKLEDGTRSFWWWSLVESPALDEAVTPERDRFMLPDEEVLAGILSIPAIRSAAIPVIAAHLEPLISPIKEKTRAQVDQFVRQDAPEYRHVVKMRPDAVDALAPDLPKDKLDSELHRLNYELEAAVRANGAKILRGDHVEPAAYEQFLSDENAIGKANLAKYVVHRRRVLDLFRKALKQAPDGTYSLEEAVHKLVFPLHKTSDDVPYEQLNLWMIDERLAYHYYLASDTELRQVQVLESDSQQRPDIIIFNAPFAFSDHDGPFSSIVIVEFKRPARDDYTDEKNPIKQVFDYIRRVRDGKAKDRAGHPMNVPEHVPFYCYIVCDMTPKIAESAENYALTKTPDSEGYFGFNMNLRAYVEVLSFTKVVADAEKRNRVLFEKLNLPK